MAVSIKTGEGLAALGKIKFGVEDLFALARLRDFESQSIGLDPIDRDPAIFLRRPARRSTWLHSHTTRIAAVRAM